MQILRRLLWNACRRLRGPGVRGERELRAAEGGQQRHVVAEAVAHRDAGRLAEALKVIDNVLATAPADSVLLFERASTLFAWGRYAEARGALLDAGRAGLQSVNFYTKLGWTCLWLGRMEEATDAMRRAVDLASDDWATHFGLGTTLRTQKCLVEARATFEHALALCPDNAHCLSSTIACEIELEDFASAERLARRSVEVHPERPGAFADLGMALCSQDRYDEAVAAFERAEALEARGADMGDDCVNFAVCLLRAARTGQAVAFIERRLRNCPSAALHAQYALALLISGRLREGWLQYEFRWTIEPLITARPNFVKPQWAGQNLDGRTILLWSEQGFGDFIQFIRYAAMLKRLGAHVIVFLRDGLHELAKGLPSIDRILRPNEPYPPFDYYINLLSIPRVLGTEIGSIPSDVPYLRADPERLTRWSARIGAHAALKVGLVWAGSPTHLRDRFRTLPFESLVPLLGVPGIRFYSLQKGPATAALESSSTATGVVDLGSDFANFADTAAAIDQLDLVIGVDTAVVHLAGALGKPVWTLIPRPADWRWLEDRDDSPWYPTMRLFRQRLPGDWPEVIDHVKTALEDLARRHTMTADSVSARVTPRSARIAPGVPASLGACVSRVAETRFGIVQYFPDDVDVGSSLEYYGEHRDQELHVLGQLVAPAMSVMEVDADVGAHALWLSRRIGHGGHLFVYEDDPRRRQVLEQNLKANGATNATLMRRRLRRTHCHAASSTANPMGDQPGSAEPASRRDETIDELRLEQLDLLKLHSGGRVIDVLEGAAETLWRLRPRLHLAVSGDDELAGLVTRVRDFGYACWRFEAPLFNPQNFNNRDKDIFSGRTLIALVALPEERATNVSLQGCRKIA